MAEQTRHGEDERGRPGRRPEEGARGESGEDDGDVEALSDPEPGTAQGELQPEHERGVRAGRDEQQLWHRLPPKQLPHGFIVGAAYVPAGSNPNFWFCSTRQFSTGFWNTSP